MTDRLIDYWESNWKDFATVIFQLFLIVSLSNLIIIPFYVILDISARVVLLTDSFLILLCLIVKAIQYVSHKFSTKS